MTEKGREEERSDGGKGEERKGGDKGRRDEGRGKGEWCRLGGSGGWLEGGSGMKAKLLGECREGEGADIGNWRERGKY